MPPLTEGTVYFAGGREFEYHNAPQKTREARNRYGWSTLGDVGYVDRDGYLFLTDRKAFMIISGGVNIYPQEIENVLIAHPRVMDVAVFGAPDDEMGEKVVAVVQPVDFAAAGPGARRRVAGVRARAAEPRQGAAADRVHARAAAPPEREALQATAAGTSIGSKQRRST